MTSLKEAQPYSDAGLLYVSYNSLAWQIDDKPGYWRAFKDAPKRWKDEAHFGMRYAIAEEA